MAAPKFARLVAAETVGPRARRLEFEMISPPMNYVGGQFVIIDTGMALASGRLAKRAYTISSADGDPSRFELVACRIDQGVCSGYLHQIEIGTELSFTGPWGKFTPAHARDEGPTWVVATDTGITAALGLLRSEAFRERLPRTTFLFLSPPADDFVSEAFIRDRLTEVIAGGARCELHVGALPPVHHVERVAAGLAHFQAMPWSDPPSSVFLTGDGALLYPFAAAISRAGLATTRVTIESFFNVPVRPPPDPSTWASR
ncbi:MAG: FAD-dependent oxidoreductase [Polyangiaceae bacterium]